MGHPLADPCSLVECGVQRALLRVEAVLRPPAEKQARLPTRVRTKTLGKGGQGTVFSVILGGCDRFGCGSTLPALVPSVLWSSCIPYHISPNAC
jgi:hypothetical protein